jgi:hypothetical protein
MIIISPSSVFEREAMPDGLKEILVFAGAPLI